MIEENNVLTIKSVQIQPLRNMATALKDILTDATLTITSEGIRIINFDKTQTILVNVQLYADKFEYYNCEPDKIVICANTIHLFKVISTMTNDDTLNIYIEKCDYNDGVVSHLSFQYENGDIKQCYTQKLKLIEPDIEELIVPNVDFSTIINLPTADFQKIIRDLNNISDRLEIKSVGSDLFFSSDGQFASLLICRSEFVGVMEFVHKPNDAAVIVQGIFPIKSLSQFIKCTPLCSNMEIYLGNNLPLIVKYNVASLGEIRLCLSPLQT